ncbi:MAG: hypothetical protein SOW08_05765 [Lachnospiraceae bacterium]|nr:hypothetical protein [Lachnospiraceae bacterium]
MEKPPESVKKHTAINNRCKNITCLRTEEKSMNNKDIKSLKRQLMAAVAMCLAAAVALGSSTYAWFVSNNRVEATGMQVQAAAEGGIEIAYTNSGASSASYATSATTGAASAISLAPTSTFNTKDWYHASAVSATASNARAETYETMSLTETSINGQDFGKLGGKTVDNTTTNYYMVQTFNIRSTSATAPAKGLTVDSVSVTGNTNTNTMNEALRVAVVFNSNVLIYDPVANDQTSYNVYNGFTGDGSASSPYTATQAGTVTCKDATNKNILASEDTEIPAKGNSNNGGVDVQVYIWFEGEDALLYSENFATEGLTVTINFSSTV